MADGVTWDLTSYFPEFDGPEMKAFEAALAVDVEALRAAAEGVGPLTDATAATWEELLLVAEGLKTRFSHIFSYVGCLGAADAANDEYGRKRAALTTLASAFEKFDVDLLHALKAADDDVFERFLAREKLAGAEYVIRRTRERAAFTMDREREILTSDLTLDGLHAWGRLYDTITGKLTFDMKWPDGKTETLPISRWRSLTASVDRAVGRAAFEAGNESFRKIEDTCAACLNAISGTRLHLNRHRDVDHFLTPALFGAAIERKTLDAMYAAIHGEIEIGREFCRARARAMGRESIAYFEREAPVPLPAGGEMTWAQGRDMVARSFRSVYPALADYFAFALERGWYESESRGGKRPGAFCTGSGLTKEQRVYMTFNGTLGDVATLAHETGHAFHGHVMKDLRPFAKSYPMTLAETASLFGEAILSEGILGNPDVDDDAKLSMLDGDLSRAVTTLLDITVRFEWEKAFHEERAKGEVSVARLKELMVETQRTVFGDAMSEGGEDPYFWASKLHFYISGVTFYNFPYTFGMLLARALFLRLKEEGPSFLPRYEEFLRLTGSATAEEVARRSIGADLGDPEFWAGAIRSYRTELSRYQELLGGRVFPA